MRLLLGVFLIAHGLIHASYVSPRPADAATWPFDLTRSWLLGFAGAPVLRPLGLLLAAAATAAFVLAGLGVLGVPGLHGLWRSLAVTGAAASLLLLGLYWHPWLGLGVLLSLALLIAVGALHWPSTAITGP